MMKNNKYIFYNIWAFKESYLKYIGCGLNNKLPKICYSKIIKNDNNYNITNSNNITIINKFNFSNKNFLEFIYKIYILFQSVLINKKLMRLFLKLYNKLF